eukprot:364491-Chlamydomonas_euryale.AAC.4
MVHPLWRASRAGSALIRLHACDAAHWRDMEAPTVPCQCLSVIRERGLQNLAGQTLRDHPALELITPFRS